MADDVVFNLLNNKEPTKMLEFETEIFLDILRTDGLVVAAKGLSMDVVILNVLKVYCDPGNLVIVLNCTEFEEKYFIEKLKSEHVHHTTFTTNVSDREDIYLSGGIHFVTTRILVVDMLKKRIPIEKITGFLVMRAHRVLESCQEAFALRLYRQQNKTGFIKAFSNSAQSFTIGFGHVERIMRTLMVKELYLWPRFHSTVLMTMKQHQPQIIELHIPISNTMSKIQTCLLDLMNLIVKELKSINPTVDMQEITVENCLSKAFHKILQTQLDFIWNQLSFKSRQLVSELKTLRHLIVTMLNTDPVTFYAAVSNYRSAQYAQSSTWVLLEPAELLFTYTTNLIFINDQELNPEFCPKWDALSEILKTEIPIDIQKTNDKECKILILCQDKATCFQLNQFLRKGPHFYLFLTAFKEGVKFKSISKKFEKCQYLQDKSRQSEPDLNNSKFSKKHKTEEDSDKSQSESQDENQLEDKTDDFKNSYVLTMSQSVCQKLDDDESKIEDESEYIFEPFEQMENMDLTQLCSNAKTSEKPTILIQTFNSGDNSLSLQKTLEDVCPNYIIMYHSNVTAVRQIELYDARRQKEQSLKIYFLIHNETVEEQSYLTILRREKEAFEYLIQTKATMTVPEDQDGKTDHCIALQREVNTPEISTRQGGRNEINQNRQFIIVDMREFRSELPSLIHKRGIDIEPVTIAVGDYILTPDICIERKSLSDLIGSLNSGRLYQQCIQMNRYYTNPMLLIEFDQNKPFSWQNNYIISSDETSFEIQQKLLLLTLHFPKLKIVWSANPYASAQLFEELKEGKEQPNIQFAVAIGNENDLDIIETKYNAGIYDFIQKLPGITTKNIDGFLRQTGNMNNAVKKSQEELKDILGNSIDARALYSALHEEHAPKKTTEPTKSKRKLTNKNKFPKKR